MDTSGTYIKMCGKAEEIQQLRNHIYEGGDYCYCSECGLFIHCEGKLYDFDGIVWLPRQDQLQEMVFSDDVGVQTITTAIEQFSKTEVGATISIFGSMEQLWLAFAMKEKYNKVWDGEQWTSG